MRFGPRVPLGILGAFALATVGCSGGSPAQPSGDLPAAVAERAVSGFPTTSARGAHRLGGVRRAIAGCTGSGMGSFVGANNSNVAAGTDSGVLSGFSNEACDGYSGIISGFGNAISSSGSASDEFIGGGENNQIGGGSDTFIGGGNSNAISSGSYGFIGGGYTNKASGEYTSIVGGNSNTASGTESTVAGGGNNIASGYASFAAGSHADADEGGSFVWSDTSSSSTTKATVANQFVARTAGGVKFFSNSAMTTGVSLAAGGGSWASVSDRAVKTNVESIDDAAILDRVAAMPISEWSYISERGVRHVGPMAQDFYAAFGVGEDNKHITSIDEDGVALAAIKALDARLKQTNRGLSFRVARAETRLAQKDAALHTLQGQMAAMKSQMERLMAKVATMH